MREGDTQRIIGKLEEFKETTQADLTALKSNVAKILEFQAQVKMAVKFGHVMVGFISGIVSTAITLFVKGS